MKHLKYPSIELFDKIVRQVRENHDFKGKDNEGKPIYLHDTPYKTIKFIGYEKLHGTNASIVLWKDGNKTYQSRDNILSYKHDNMGFYTYLSTVDTNYLFEGIEFEEYIAVYGEWCGKGVQKHVGLKHFEKMFVIFGIKVDGKFMSKTYNNDPQKRIYDIKNFKKWELEIDFNYPKLSENIIYDYIMEVEEKSPICYLLNPNLTEDIVGEGIVFHSECNSYRFKAKGEKHANGSKTKSVAKVDIEKYNTVSEFVERVCSNSRLEQGISYLRENNHVLDKISTPIYLKWIINDVIKEFEEELKLSNLTIKDVAPSISNKAKVYFFSELNSYVGL